MADNFKANDAEGQQIFIEATEVGSGIYRTKHAVMSVPADPFGTNADAAIITDTTGSWSGKLRGLVKWAYERMPASLGQKTKANSLPVVISSDQDTLNVSIPLSTSGGCTTYSAVSASGQNATVVKASAGQVFALALGNVATSFRVLKLYNMATSPASSDTPVLRYIIPGNSTGAGSNFVVPAGANTFSVGIAYRITAGVADADTGPISVADVIVNIFYK